ncbi:MAG: hypothetical protein JWM10_484 [Myxococcaceae bacterium]|nr:hypothetical protein [Myxococcaceae bacterium]
MTPASNDPAERIRRAQERALRAARAVTLTLGATLAGCAATVGGSPAEVPPMEAAAGDVGSDVGNDTGAVTAADAGEDAGEDAGAVKVADAGEDVSADAGESCTGDERDGGETWAQCCARLNWDWNRGCGAWGPFMPPSMEG